jgi:hypothetical protein
MLTHPDDLLDPDENPVLRVLEKEGLSSSIGLYFYLFKNQVGQRPFIKIGECTSTRGIEGRFVKGWHGYQSGTDSYVWTKRQGEYVKKAFGQQITQINEENPAYFVFYEHQLYNSHPKIDEGLALTAHLEHFSQKTLSPEKINGNARNIGRNLVWHRTAFNEVLNQEFPDGVGYP